MYQTTHQKKKKTIIFMFIFISCQTKLNSIHNVFEIGSNGACIKIRTLGSNKHNIDIQTHTLIGQHTTH